MKRNPGEKIFQIIDIIVMVFIMATIIMPLMHIFSISVSDSIAVSTMQVGLFPKGFNTAAYKQILEDSIFLRALFNTAFITIIITLLSVIVTTMISYALSKDYFFGKKFVTYYFVIIMYFSGGLIPTYLLISRYLKLNNTYLAYILPALVNVFYIIVVKSQIQAIPQSLVEAAYIDGAGEYQVLFKIIIPVILPTIAAISMFIALGSWNMWYSVLLYASKKEMWTLQYFLRAVVFEKFLSSYADNVMTIVGAEKIPPQNFQMAAIILVALPIVAIYPFVQKYFVKGILAGSVKG